VQYAAQAYIGHLPDSRVAISISEAGVTWQNGYAERLIRTIKGEEIDLSEYEDYDDALNQFGHFLDEVYLHAQAESFGSRLLTPVEFESLWFSRRTRSAPCVCSRLSDLLFVSNF
jgi:transposase InsO family protein